jgi:ferredoxin-like protein FixX
MSIRPEQNRRTGNSLEESQRDLADNLCYERTCLAIAAPGALKWHYPRGGFGVQCREG